jgi:hypothetical protein
VSGRRSRGANPASALVRYQVDALNRKDLDTVASLYARDAVLEIGAGPPVVGLAAIRRAYERHVREWEETVTLTRVAARGARVTAVGVAAGHHRSPRLNIPGRIPLPLHPYRHSFRASWEIHSGQISHHRVEYDLTELVRQLLDRED